MKLLKTLVSVLALSMFGTNLKMLEVLIYGPRSYWRKLKDFWSMDGS